MNSETKSYEAQILQQLIDNAKAIAVMQKEILDIKSEISEIKTELKEVKATANRSEWWLRAIAGAIVVSFFKDQLMSFLLN
ncbi:MAG: hypothetical protein AAGA80_02280 [Cyanobacteria bacterium P01_F01_bin.143]